MQAHSPPRASSAQLAGDPAPATRPVLSLKRNTAPAPAAQAPALEWVADDAEVSFVNWRVGHRRPTRRYLSAAEALAEARRLRAATGAVIQTYRLELLSEPEGAA